jgi:hypothetical protein
MGVKKQSHKLLQFWIHCILCFVYNKTSSIFRVKLTCVTEESFTLTLRMEETASSMQQFVKHAKKLVANSRQWSLNCVVQVITRCNRENHRS